MHGLKYRSASPGAQNIQPSFLRGTQYHRGRAPNPNTQPLEFRTNGIRLSCGIYASQSFSPIQDQFIATWRNSTGN